MPIWLPCTVEAGRIRNPSRGCGKSRVVPARSRRPLPPASLRPAPRVTVHAAGRSFPSVATRDRPPASCPVLPLRDGLRFAHFPALDRSPCSLFNRREQGELLCWRSASTGGAGAERQCGVRTGVGIHWRSQSQSFPSTLRPNRVEGKRALARTTQRIAGRRAADARGMPRARRVG